MTKRMLIDAAHADETRVVIVENNRIFDYDFVTSSKTQLKGNIYLAKITRVAPSLQAAFVEYGGGKQGFLPFSEIHPDYYQIPQDDRKKLLEEQIAEAEAEEAAEDEAFEREQAAREARRHHRGELGEEVEGELPDAGDDIAADPLVLAEVEPLVAAPTTEPLPEALPEMSAVEVPQAFVVPEQTQPLLVEPYMVASDVVDSLPEDQALTDASATDQTLQEELSQGTAEQTAPPQAEDNDDGRRRPSFHRRYRIQEVIKRNQIVLVQVIKEERGNKGCSLTTYVSLAGRTAVLMPNSPRGGGISRKITDRETRRNLKEIASELRTHKGMSVIIRTAGIDRTKAEIRRDFEYLAKLWNQVRENTLQATAPALIYEEGNLVKRTLRDLYTSDIEEVIIEGEEACNEAKDFMRILLPSHVNNIKLYKDSLPLFSYAGIEDQLAAMTEPQVRLPSGGYIVINPTEALISIDVNSGRSTTERNVEETALKTNLEAAREVARQLRLRDLAGLIVIDFIDMNYGKNRKSVERAMKEALKSDRAKTQMGRISMFGLMELSRQRMRPSIAESMGILCPHCRGTGYVHSVETIGIQIIRALEKEAASREYATLRVTTTAEVALYLLNEKRTQLQSIEARYAVNVVVLMDSTMLTGNMRLIKVTNDGKEVLHEDARQPQQKRGRRRGKRGGRGGDAPGNVNFDDVVETSDEEATDDAGDAREDDHEVIGAANDNETHSEFRESRGDRGGRNRGRRGRGRDRHRFRDDNAPTDGTGDVQAAASGDMASEPRENSDGNDYRGERRGRGRRGGRGRNRFREPRAEQAQADATGADAAFAAPPPPLRPSADIYEVPRSAPPSLPEDAPRASFVIPLSEAQTNPNAIASPITSESTGSDDKPKRKGWWSKVLE